MWTIGYKAWGMIMGRRLADHGCVGVCVDYRNYPQTNIVGMLEDHRDALIWIHTHINQYGGDPDNIWVVGQSAGAHLSALLMLLQAKASEVVAHAAADLTDSSANDLDSAEFEPPVASCSSQWQPTSHLFATTDAILDDVDLSSFNLTASLAASGPVLQSCFDSRVLVSPAVLKLMPRIRGWVGIAGPYQISSPYLTYIETRGLNRSFLHDIFWDAVPKRQIVQSDGSTLLQDDVQAASSVDPIQERARHDEVESHLWTLSPICLVQRDTDLRACWQHLPPVFLLHGECDLSVPYEASWNFATALLHLSTPTSEAHIQQCNSSTSSSSALPIYLRRYSGMTHTDPIIEAPMRGRDPLMADLLSIVHRSGYGAAGEAGSCSCSTELPPSSHCALQNLLPLHRAAHDIDNSTLQSMFNSMRPCPRDAPSLPLLDRISDFFGYAASDVSGEVGAAAEPALVGPQLAPVWLINVARWLNPF
jgi:acetyl esterase/lipase